jgi:hypothetical protein
VIGLPMERTTEVLAQFGLQPVNASRPQLRAGPSQRVRVRASTPCTKTKR